MNSCEQTLATTMVRPEYQDGRVLSAADLEGDAEALATAWNGHQARVHRGGVVAGLWLAENNGEVTVGPGGAVDAEGRLILVNMVQKVALTAPAGRVAIRLEYAVRRDPALSAASELDRWEEFPKVSAEALDAMAGCMAVAKRESVLLGVYYRKGPQDAWTLDGTSRIYVVAAGGRIDAISGRARVLLGPEFPRDSRRFAVGLPTGADQKFTDVISWETTGSLTMQSPVSISHPREKNLKPDAKLQPPILIVGVPSVYLTADDVVDPCRASKAIYDESDKLHKRIAELLKTLSFDSHAPPPACVNQLTRLIVRILNRLICKVADERFAATALLPKPPPITPGSTSWAIQRLSKRFYKKVLRHVLLPGATSAKRLTLFKWRKRPDALLCRLLLDQLFAGSIVPLKLPPARGIVFKEPGLGVPEPSPGRIHLAAYEQDKKKVRELRITIPDPGEKNHPERYRCSIGKASDCKKPEFDLEHNPLNRQTGQPRGILSILADRSVDLHRDLNVFADPETLLPGLILQLAPPDASGPSGAGGPSGSGQPGVPAPVLPGAVIWDILDTLRTAPDAQHENVTITGRLHNQSDRAINSLTLFATLYAQNDTQNAPQQTKFITQRPLSPNTAIDIDILFGPVSLDVLTFHGKDLVLNLLVLGATADNEIVRTQEQRVLSKV